MHLMMHTKIRGAEAAGRGISPWWGVCSGPTLNTEGRIMNILIVAASRSGWTAGIAEWIADEIRQAGHQVTLAPADSAPSPNGFDAAFVGSGIRAGKWEEAGSAYLTAHADALRTMPLVTFLSSLRAADPSEESRVEVARYTSSVVEPLGLTPAAHGSHAGGYDPKRVSLPERMIMTVIRQGAKVDLRDEAAVRAWAREAMGAVVPA